MKRITSIAAAILACVVATSSRAQDAWLSQPQTTERLLADQLSALALVALEGQGEPTPGQLLRSRTLLDMALELVDDDPQLWRLRSELAYFDGQDDVRIQALRQYARLSPGDDAVQYALIVERLELEQTMDGRVNMVERMLASDSAKSLSAPLRSRLATFAAIGAQEIGDRERYLRWLKEALKLDETNAIAAKMTYEYTAERTQDPLYLGSALINLIRANPTDHEARLAMAQLLMGQFAIDAAVDQYEMTAQLSRAPLALEDWQQYVIASAVAHKPSEAMSRIDSAMQAVEGQIAAAAEAGEELENPQEVSQTLLSVELLRLAILHATDQTERADESFERMRELSAQSTESASLSLPLTAVVFNRHIELAEQASQEPQRSEAAKQRLNGWLAIRRDENEKALELLSPLAEEDAAAAYGVALAQADEAARHAALRAVAGKWSHTPIGAMAMLQLQQAGVALEPTPTGTSLLNLMQRTPRRVWYADFQVQPWVSMKIDVIPPRVSYLEPIFMDVTIRNLSGVPMAVGTGMGVPSRMWLTIEPILGGESLGPQPPIVVDLMRTIRLDSGQAFKHRMRIDRAAFGLLRSINPTTTLNWRVTGTLDPYVNRFGVIQFGPLGARSKVGSLIAIGLPITVENIDIWLADLDSDDPLTVCRAVARLLKSLDSPPESADAGALQTRIADAINGRYANGGRMVRAWIVNMLALAGDDIGLLQRVTDDAERSDDPMIRLLYLNSTVKEAQSNSLLAAMRHSDPVISGFAEALRSGLEAQAAAEAAAREAQENP